VVYSNLKEGSENHLESFNIFSENDKSNQRNQSENKNMGNYKSNSGTNSNNGSTDNKNIKKLL